MVQGQNSVLLIFIDGLGIGTLGNHNPLVDTAEFKPIAHFTDTASNVGFDGLVAPTDPRLGIDGRPQSASGQTTILTGINAPELLGYHKLGFPNAALREIIAEHSIFLQLKRLGIDETVFANAYTPQFFHEPPRWRSATTCAVEAADLQFRKLPDLVGRKAVFHDFTNQMLAVRGFDVDILSPSDAAEILAGFTRDYRFTLYEHFITDKIGHDRDIEKAKVHLPLLAKFVCETLKNIDLEITTVILTSDHGNVEDLSVRNHTLNDVPTIVWGRKNSETARSIRDLTHITPAIVRLLTE